LAKKNYLNKNQFLQTRGKKLTTEKIILKEFQRAQLTVRMISRNSFEMQVEINIKILKYFN